MRAHISDTDEWKEKLALFDLHYSFIPAFTMFSFFLDTDDLDAKLANYTLENDNHLALIEEKLHQTNSTGILFNFFLNV